MTRIVLWFMSVVADEIARYQAVDILVKAYAPDHYGIKYPDECVAAAVYAHCLLWIFAHCGSIVGIWVFQRCNFPLIVALLYNLRSVAIIYHFLTGHNGLLLYLIGYVLSAREYLAAEMFSRYRNDPRVRLYDTCAGFFASIFALIYLQVRNISALADPSLRRPRRSFTVGRLGIIVGRAGINSTRDASKRLLIGSMAVGGIAVVNCLIEMCLGRLSKEQKELPLGPDSSTDAPSAPSDGDVESPLAAYQRHMASEVPAYKDVLAAIQQYREAPDEQRRAEAGATLYELCARRDNRVDQQLSQDPYCSPQVVAASSVIRVDSTSHPLISICFNVIVHPLFFAVTYTTMFLAQGSVVAYAGYGNNTEPFYFFGDMHERSMFGGGPYGVAIQFSVFVAAMFSHMSSTFNSVSVFRGYVAVSSAMNGIITFTLAVMMVASVRSVYPISMMCAVAGLLEIGRNEFVYPYTYRRTFDKATLSALVALVTLLIKLPYFATLLPAYVLLFILAVVNGLMLPISLWLT